MEAIPGSLAKAAKEALNAGCDIVLCCHGSLKQIDEIYETLAAG